MIQVTTGSDAVIPSPIFVGPDGYTTTEPDDDPTVTLTRDDGTDVVFGGPTETDGLWSITIDSDDLASPDLLTATWTAEVGGATQQLVQEIDVAGGVYVPLPELWNLEGLQAGKYTGELLTRLRIEFEGIAERWTGQAWVPRFASEVHGPSWPSWSNGILLGHRLPRLIAGATDDLNVTIDMTNWELTRTGLVRWAYLARASTIRYHHGADRPPPELVEACKDYVRSKALERVGGNRIGRDVLSMSDGTGASTRYSTPDWAAGRPTGLLDVDRTLLELGAPVPGIA